MSSHLSSHLRSTVLAASVTALGMASSWDAVAQAEIQEVPGAMPARAVGPHAPDAAPVTVVVIMSGDPVALVQKNMGRELTRGERESVISQRASEHLGVQSEVQRRGGKVLAHFHSALNGVKIQISRQHLAALRAMSGVVDIQTVGTYQRNNATGIPLIGAPLAWQLPAAIQGQGVKIAVIDTGIDYTHADFGGPGTAAAYALAKATNTAPANPALFGPAAPKVKGGTDLVGDAYDGSNTPVPDPNPLDCESTSGSDGHGTHVAGTATGFGVKADGTTFSGPYNAAAYTPGAFSIGPGVAPKADLYSVRVFGCQGSTNVVAEAIDWAVANGMNVISMSLGSDFGNPGNADAGSSAEKTAVANAVAAGIQVVAASGNAGPTPYITSAPAVYPGAISVAATDALAGVPTASLKLSSGATITVQNSNSGVFANGSTWPIVVLRNADGTVSLGCNPNEYDKTKNGGIDITGKLVVTVRGTCARVFRAGAAQHFGAAASAMINTAAGYPSYEGPISGGAPDPNSGNIYEPVTIPFFGVLTSDTVALTGPTGGPAPASAIGTATGILANANFEKVASFSSAGPRIGDSVLRPGVTAPGVSTVSAASGTGNGFLVLSGTSMATPHIAGVAALVKQANPTWSLADQRAAVIQTAAPALLGDYTPRNEGSGLTQALAAVTTQAVVRTPDDSVSFGFADLLTDFSATKQLTVHNFGPKAVQFTISVVKVAGPAAATATTPATVVVAANSDAQFPVTLSVPASAGTGGTTFQDIGGYIQLTPAARLNGNVKLSVPYYLVTHGRSNVAASLSGSTINFTNAGSALATTTPGLWHWGLSQPVPQGVTQNDVRAVGTLLSGSNVFFGINTHGRVSTTLASQEIDICIDTSGNAGFTPNMVLIGINGSALTSSLASSTYATALFPTDANCNINGAGSVLFTVTQPTDNSVLQMPVPRAGTAGSTGLGLTAAKPRFKYQVFYFGTDGGGAAMPGTGSFNAFTPALTFANTGAVLANGTRAVTVTRNAEAALTPVLGVMATAADNIAGASQGLLLPLP